MQLVGNLHGHPQFDRVRGRAAIGADCQLPRAASDGHSGDDQVVRGQGKGGVRFAQANARTAQLHAHQVLSTNPDFTARKSRGRFHAGNIRLRIRCTLGRLQIRLHGSASVLRQVLSLRCQFAAEAARPWRSKQRRRGRQLRCPSPPAVFPGGGWAVVSAYRRHGKV